MRPMLGREIVKGKQYFFIFVQAFAGFGEFALVTGDELIVGRQSGFASRRQVFHGSVASLCPERFLAFCRGYWRSYEPSNAVGQPHHILPAERSKSPVTRHRWPAWARSIDQGA